MSDRPWLDEVNRRNVERIQREAVDAFIRDELAPLLSEALPSQVDEYVPAFVDWVNPESGEIVLDLPRLSAAIAAKIAELRDE